MPRLPHLVSHGNVADGDTQAQHLLQLELDGGLDLLDLRQDGGRSDLIAMITQDQTAYSHHGPRALSPRYDVMSVSQLWLVQL